MGKTVRDIMRKEIRTVSPDMKIANLEQTFIQEHIGGAPVRCDGKLIGVVSRSDIVRHLSVEQSIAEIACDYYRDPFVTDPNTTQQALDICSKAGERIQQLSVQDIMVKEVITISPEASTAELAKLLLDHQIHRVLVTENDELIGIVTTTDLIKLFADA